MTTPALSPARRAVLTRRVRMLVASTITYNVLEAVVAVSAGAVASSTALAGLRPMPEGMLVVGLGVGAPVGGSSP
jgi:hypothetical protein